MLDLSQIRMPWHNPFNCEASNTNNPENLDQVMLVAVMAVGDLLLSAAAHLSVALIAKAVL